MASETNVHVPEDLLAEAANAARDRGKTTDDLVSEALRLFLELKGLDVLPARGRIYAARAGTPDPVKAVRDVRRGL